MSSKVRGINLFTIFTLLFCILHVSAQQSKIDLSIITLPDGFKIEIFAQFDELKDTRQIVRSDKGTIFVSTFEEGAVYAIKDKDGDFKADWIRVLATNLTMPNGVALRGGSLYVAEVYRIIRFDDIENTLENPSYVVVKDDLPTETWHGWKFIDFGPDGKLYVPIGSPCNICDRGDPFGTINRMNPDGTQFEVVARGVRNSVGFDWDQSGNLWFSENGRDELGDDIPPDELNYVPKTGLKFGFPHCHGTNIPDPEFGNGTDCNSPDVNTPPKVNFDAHSAALGVNFYTHDQFPEKYRGGMFIAHHGSWNRKQKIGYRVWFVKADGDKIVESEVFAEGWLQGQITKGRPVDTEQLEDGSLLVSDDLNGVIYRISYEKSSILTIVLIVLGVAAVVGVISGIGFVLFKSYKLKKLKNVQDGDYKEQIDTNEQV